MILALFMKRFRFVCVNYDYYIFGFSLSLMNNELSCKFFVLELSIPFTFDNYVNAVVTCVLTYICINIKVRIEQRLNMVVSTIFRHNVIL